MRKFKNLLFILIICLFLPIGYIFSMESSMSSFSGSGHSFEGCHADTITASSIGTVNLTSSVEGAVISGS